MHRFRSALGSYIIAIKQRYHHTRFGFQHVQCFGDSHFVDLKLSRDCIDKAGIGQRAIMLEKIRREFCHQEPEPAVLKFMCDAA